LAHTIYLMSFPTRRSSDLMLNQLNELSTKFNELSLLPNGILKILQELHTYLKTDTLYITDESQTYYYPPEASYAEEKIRQHVNDQVHQPATERLISLKKEKFAFVPVKEI